MKISQLNFEFPEDLIAQYPIEQSRVMFVDNCIQEISKNKLIENISPGDVFVINDTKVIKRRIYAKLPSDFEFLFLEDISNHHESKYVNRWSVLCKASAAKVNEFILPEDIKLKIIEKGIPQIVEVSKNLDNSYFEKYGELPLPPYIQKARHKLHNIKQDEKWYQTQWAEVLGSQAAPTASLHFTIDDLNELKNKDVNIETLTLHVGLGTFLPVRVEDLNDHKMHHEDVEIPIHTWKTIQQAKREGHKVWALGTTVARALEACALNHLELSKNGYRGSTDLLIQEGFSFQIVDFLMTNFHQPQSTLLALVCGFVGYKRAMTAYHWAIKNRFRLFSYGDLSVWEKSVSSK